MSYLLFPSSSLFSLASATTQGVHGGIRGWAVGGSVRRGGGGRTWVASGGAHGWVAPASGVAGVDGARRQDVGCHSRGRGAGREG